MAEEMTKITVVLSTDLVERVRNACAARGERLAHVFTKGLQGQVRAMEHSNGQKFKPRRKALQVGRPTKAVVGVLWGLAMAGCSHGLQEVGFAVPDAQDKIHHIVTRDVASSRWSVNQPHTAGQFHCTKKRSSEEMAVLRQDGNEHTWYTGCTPTSQMPQHQYALTADQSIASLVQGPVSAAMISAGVAFAGHQIGRGLGKSGDTVNNANSNEAEGGKGGSVNQNNGNTSTRSITQTNNNTVKVGK